MKRLSIAVILIVALFTSSLRFAQLALPDWPQNGHIITGNPPESSTQAAEGSSSRTSHGDLLVVMTLEK